MHASRLTMSNQPNLKALTIWCKHCRSQWTSYVTIPQVKQLLEEQDHIPCPKCYRPMPLIPSDEAIPKLLKATEAQNGQHA